MTQRSERWLIVGACVVLYALAMFAVAALTQQPVRWLVDWLNASIGLVWAAVVIAAPIVAAGIYGFWPDPSYTPPPAANTRFPRWVRIIGNLYLGLIGAAIVAGIAAMVIGG